MSMCALSAIAYKCGVDKEDLEADLTDLLTVYNKGAVRQVKPKEIQSALKMYCEKAMATPRESLEHWQGWEYKPIKRNGLKQKQHLYLARRRKEDMKVLDIPLKNPEGRKPKKETVEDWQLSNPGRSKADCIRETGLDRKTVSKYWEM